MAAAFRAPVGGVLFALEETSSWWSHRLLWRAFFTTAVVSVVVRSSAKLCAGKSCGYFGSGGFIIFEMREGQVGDNEPTSRVSLALSSLARRFPGEERVPQLRYA